MDIVITYCNQNDYFWKKEYDNAITNTNEVIHNANDHNRYLDRAYGRLLVDTAKCGL